MIVLNVISGKDAKELRGKLEARQSEHPLLVDLREKGRAFDAAAGKYAAKVAS